MKFLANVFGILGLLILVYLSASGAFLGLVVFAVWMCSHSWMSILYWIGSGIGLILLGALFEKLHKWNWGDGYE